MTETRLSTVFDYSNLRLHPDGTRVYQKSTNLIPRIAKSVVRTSRNNWIARDAGGIANIRKFKTTSQHLQGDEEVISLRTGINSEDEEHELEEEGKKRKPKRPDNRKAKRQKFLENYDYLTDAGTETFPYEPSSDLLKCILRYASEYYTESGQLLNCSKDYRKERKKMRDEKKAKDRTAASTSPRNSRTSTPKDESPVGFESDTSIQDYGNEGSSSHKLEEMDKPQRKGRQRTAKQYRDMYKLFDGSAIMAIGMLVQEYIAEALDPQTGEWDEELLKAFTADYTSEGEGDATDADIDGSDSNAEIDSDEQGESSCQSDDNGSELVYEV